MVTDTGADNVTAGVPAEVEPLYADPAAEEGVNGRRGSGRRPGQPLGHWRERWPPEPYCLAATPGTGYCGELRSFRSLDAGPVKKVARLPHPPVSRARFGPCAKLACVPNSPPSIRPDARTLGAGGTNRGGGAGQLSSARDGRSAARRPHAERSPFRVPGRGRGRAPGPHRPRSGSRDPRTGSLRDRSPLSHRQVLVRRRDDGRPSRRMRSAHRRGAGAGSGPRWPG